LFAYALNKSFAELCSSVNLAKQNLNDDDLKREVYFRLGSCLHWLMDGVERIEKNSEYDAAKKRTISVHTNLPITD
jgi:hypothetical protein